MAFYLKIQLSQNLLLYYFDSGKNHYNGNIIMNQYECIDPNINMVNLNSDDIKQYVDQFIGNIYNNIISIKCKSDLAQFINNPSKQCCLVSIYHGFKMKINNTLDLDVNSMQLVMFENVFNLSFDFDFGPDKYDQVYLLFNIKKPLIKLIPKIDHH